MLGSRAHSAPRLVWQHVPYTRSRASVKRTPQTKAICTSRASAVQPEECGVRTTSSAGMTVKDAVMGTNLS